MKRSRRKSRRSLSSTQWTLLMLFLIILALAALIALSWVNRPAAVPPDLITPSVTPGPTSTGTPTAIPPTSAPPTLLPSPTLAIFSPTFTVSDCRFTVPRGASITCGVIPVPEDRHVYPGRTVRLSVAIFNSNSPLPAEDPVIYLHDSPIGSAIQWAAVNYDNFVLPIIDKRDLIVFDFRGSGLSLPNLDCPEVMTVQKLDQRGSLAGGQKSIAYTNAVSACQERLASHGVDVSQYTTRSSAEDARDVIRALGLEKVNLFSSAYGSRVAQMVLQENPQEIRSAIFDSPLPLEVNLYKDAAAHYDQALKTLFGHCTADPVCSSTYPDLSSVYDNLVSQLDAEPLQITLPGDPGGPDYDLSLDGKTLTRAVLSALDSSYYISSLPRIITGFNSGDTDTSLTFIQTALTLPEQPLLNPSSGMRLSTDCHEQVYASTAQELEQAQAAFPLTNASGMEMLLGDSELLYNLCSQWEAAPYDPADNQQLQTELPMLVLGGQFDSLYPVEISRQFAEDQPGGLFLEVPGIGHAPTFSRRSTCPMSLVSIFLDNPGQVPTTDCLKNLTLTYHTTYTGEPPLELVPVENEELGLRTVVPASWINRGQGVYKREAYYGDFTEMQIQVSSSPTSEWLAALTDGFNGAGFDRTPARNTTRYENRLNWTLYRAFSVNKPVELAFAETGEQTLMVLLLSQTSERDALYRAAFLPTIDVTVLE